MSPPRETGRIRGGLGVAMKLRASERGIERPGLWGLTVGAVILVLGVAAAPARAAATAYCDASSYRLALRSLTGAKGYGAQLVIRVSTRTLDCELPETLDDVHATIGRRVVDYRSVR